jgi:type II secretory pathway component PulF
LSEGAKAPAEKGVYENLQDSLCQGKSLSEALNMQRIFPSGFTHAIRAGEASGAVDKILAQFAVHLKRSEDVRRKIIEASIYPALVLLAGIGTLFVLLKIVVPKLSGLYKDFGAELPQITKFILGMSDHSFLLFATFLFFTSAFAFLISRNRHWLLKIPGLCLFFLKADLFRFSSTLSLLLKSGLPLLNALEISGEGSSSAHEIAQIREALLGGQSFSTALCQTKWVDSSHLALIRAGEESGQLVESLSQIAEETEADLQSLLEMMTKLIEPLLILGVGGAVGLIVIGTLLPVFDLNRLFQ